MEYSTRVFELPLKLIDAINQESLRRSLLFKHEVSPSAVARQWIEQGMSAYPDDSMGNLGEQCNRIAYEIERIIPDNLPLHSETILPLLCMEKESTAFWERSRNRLELASDHYGETTKLDLEATLANLAKVKDGAGADIFWGSVVNRS